MNGAQYIVNALHQQGVTQVFGYPGGAIMPMYDALYDGGIPHLLCRREQGCYGRDWLCPQQPPGRRLYRDLRPWSDQPDHGARRRDDGLYPRGGHHGPGC